jgi:hypothetical protein
MQVTRRVVLTQTELDIIVRKYIADELKMKLSGNVDFLIRSKIVGYGPSEHPVEYLDGVAFTVEETTN